MASVGFGTVAPAVASPAARTTSMAGRRARSSTLHVPAATKVVTAAKQGGEEKGLFDTIFGALYKEEQLLETDPILNKVAGGKAPAAPAPKKAAAAPPEASGGNGGFSLGGFFSKPKTKKG
ncbi:hypothetical protein BDA96_02G091500 [Sorghum bicolor]|jgi:hypothetical protein|uniref:Uncharacterized protein n=2 Tax=Sorghum bicolor TaxID=4558 RepID=A0A921RM75_SORBI|nr:uncharacterized protein LOC8081792 [Sorghum bicolor]EER96117.1 hypothetical protein SORBI_3002G088200 [Sorghum bicolor]KAG0542300.1 hypothetical protein BDA96_02G091500 [Sorghum bicolor]|eukprot:XP_002459596.1 uncharacterized protein LOC8081792 [Sorghum bicolor]